MLLVFYGRYSTNYQEPTSIEDQLRRCLAHLEKAGLNTDDLVVYRDDAVNGGTKGLGKRLAFERMMDAIEADTIGIIVADEVSRLVRNVRDAARLYEFVEERGLRIMTADGFDTGRQGWQVMWQMQLMMAMEESRQIGSRTQRTMEGTLVRGLMIGSPPLGYRVSASRLDEYGQLKKGALWEIDAAEAKVVEDIFRWRAAGRSVASIARTLNGSGVPNPGKGRKGASTCYWRPATVHRITSNAIYRGAFILHGSPWTRARRARKRLPIEPKTFERPQFRLVSDELWWACNPVRPRQSVRGGGKHLLSGLLRCGECNCTLSLKANSTSRSLHCPQCDQAVRVGEARRFVGYTSEGVALRALEAAIVMAFSEPVMAQFQERLQKRLNGGDGDEVARLTEQVRAEELAIGRCMALAGNPKLPLQQIERQLEEHQKSLGRLRLQLERLEGENRSVTKALVRKQLAVDPRAYVMRLLRCEGVPVQEVRATLARLIPHFRFVDKPARYHAVFELEFIPGVAVGLQSATEAVDTEPVRIQVEVIGSAHRPPVWDVQASRLT